MLRVLGGDGLALGSPRARIMLITRGGVGNRPG